MSARPVASTAIMKHARAPGRGMSGVCGRKTRPQRRVCRLGKDSAGKPMVGDQGWHSTSSDMPAGRYLVLDPPLLAHQAVAAALEDDRPHPGAGSEATPLRPEPACIGGGRGIIGTCEALPVFVDQGTADSFVATIHPAVAGPAAVRAGFAHFRAGLLGVAAGRPGGELVMADETRPSPAAGTSARQALVVSCWMCGIRLHASQMVPDGGGSCGDIRWYCKDVRVCTQRWTTSRRALAASGRDQRTRGAEAGQPAGPGDQVAVVGSGASRPVSEGSPRSAEEAGRSVPIPPWPAHGAATGDPPEAERTAASGGSSRTGSSGALQRGGPVAH